MRNLIRFFMILFMTFPMLADCKFPKLELAVTQTIPAPSGYDRLFLIANDSRIELGLADAKLVLTDLAFSMLEDAKADDPSATLLWGKSSDAAKLCEQPFSTGAPVPVVPPAPQPPVKAPAAPDSTPPASTIDTANTYTQCEQMMTDERERIRAERKLRGKSGDDFTLIVMNPDVGVCAYNRAFGIMNEPIYGVIAGTSSDTNPKLTFQPCSLPTPGPNIYSAESIKPLTQAEGLVKHPIPPRVCHDASTTITVSAMRRVGPVSASHSLNQFGRYDAGFQVGVLNTEQKSHSFGLRPGPDNKMLITDKGPEGSGPEYYAGVVMYGLPHQLARLFTAQTYAGRELVHERGLADRISAFLGAGLDKPADRFSVGIGFELWKGFHGIVAYESARVRRLEGVAADSVFAGTADQIPTSDHWEGDVVFGIAIDSRIAKAIFKQ